MEKITLMATLTAVAGREAELADALVDLVAAADEEPGCEIYSVNSSRNEPAVFRFFELYTDRNALQSHGTGPQMKAAITGLDGLLAAPPEIVRLTPLAAKGFDLV